MDGKFRILMKYFLCTFFLPLFFFGCASFSKTNSVEKTAEKVDAVSRVIKESQSTIEQPAPATNNSRPVPSALATVEADVVGVKLKVNKFDLPVTVNASVEKWVNYFTGKGRPYFEKYLQRSRYFIPEIAKVLKSHNMPQDLVYLAMIESGFNNSAKSRARAVGPWQFIQQTGQRYGLKIDFWLDERRDTRKSTLAAIQYLKELYQEFGSWELSAAGYNAGENKIRRAIARYRTNDFWDIAKRRFLKRETRDYVPKIMAAAILAKNPELFGFEDPFKSGVNPSVNPTAEPSEPTPKELGEVDDAAEATEDLQDPALLKVAVSGLNIEDEAYDEEDEVMEDAEEHAYIPKSPRPTMTPSVYLVANPNEQIIEYEIKGPIDLFAVSKASGIPYSSVKLLNPELLRWCTPPYMKSYRIKLPLSIKDKFLATYNDQSFDRSVTFMEYKVRHGDSIALLARKYRTEAEPIRQLNNLPHRSNSLSKGKTIVLPLPTGYKRVIASMYDDKPVTKRRGKGRRYRHARSHRRSSVRVSSRVSRKRLKPSVARSAASN